MGWNDRMGVTLLCPRCQQLYIEPHDWWDFHEIDDLPHHCEDELTAQEFVDIVMGDDIL